jgi:hypothetical protein
MEGISMKSIIKKLGAVSLLAFSLLFCGTYNKCEALKTVTALVACEGENKVGGFETKFARDVIGKLLKQKLFEKDINLSLTCAKNRDKKKIYDFLIYISFYDNWHDDHFIKDERYFEKPINDEKVKNVILCSIREGEIDKLRAKNVLDEFDLEYIYDLITDCDVNDFISPEGTHEPQFLLRISRKNSFGCYYSFIDEKYKYEQTATKKLNTKFLKNLLKFMVKNSDCEKPIKYWLVENRAYNPLI